MSSDFKKLFKHFDVAPPRTILDLGCGRGELVEWLREQGYHAYGCDIADSDVSDYEEKPAASNYFRTIETQPYKLPFDDDQFDYIISGQVFEHVMDYESTLKEIHRVLKPGGISLHVFPARYAPIEPHVFVPLATILRSKAWLYLWAILGIRNQFQTGKSAREVAALNYKYLHAHTNYLTNRDIMSHAHFFSVAAFREDIFFKNDPMSPKRSSAKWRMVIFVGAEKLAEKILAWRHRTFFMRLLFLRK